MKDSRPASLIAGQLHEILTTHLTESFVLHWTPPLCKRPLWYQVTGTDQIILSSHVRMRSYAPGVTIVTVEPCGLIHRTAERLNLLWLRRMLSRRREQPSSALYPHVLTPNGGGTVSFITRFASSRVVSSSAVKETARHSHRPWWL